MAVRITTYAQAFALLDIDFSKNEAMKIFVAMMEKEGHTEKSICFINAFAFFEYLAE